MNNLYCTLSRYVCSYKNVLIFTYWNSMNKVVWKQYVKQVYYNMGSKPASFNIYEVFFTDENLTFWFKIIFSFNLVIS